MQTLVLQPWLTNLTLMQQTVLLTAIRGPDGIHKNHISKQILRYYRRCIMYRAFEKDVTFDPYKSGGGSFMGPLPHDTTIKKVFDAYFQTVDELPHHFQLHLMHAIEILGYKHPRLEVRSLWHNFYLEMVNDMHLNPEEESELDIRLSDSEQNWRDAEQHAAK